MLAAVLEREGLSPAQARRAARCQFGPVEALKEATLDAWGGGWIDSLRRDLRLALRSLRRSPGFALTVALTLALCIAANTTVLSALYGLVLRPLPVPEPERLVQLFNLMGSHVSFNQHSNSSWMQYLDLEARTDLFESCALRNPVTKLVRDGSSARRLKGQSVSAEFFELMGARPRVGRFFRPEEVAPGAEPLVVLTQSEWERSYGADPGVIGRQIIFDADVSHTVIGVAPRSMEAFDAEARFFIPFEFDSRTLSRNTGRYSARSNDLWLRLQPGVTREVALEQIRIMESAWYENEADANARESFKDYGRFAFDLPHPLRGSLYLLEAGSILILLVGCFNVVTLVLNRVGRRRHELAIRGALGAGKSDLRRLLLMESGALAGGALVAGTGLAWAGVHVINEYLQVLSPRTPPVSVNGAVLGATSALTLALLATMALLPIEMLWRVGALQRLDRGARVASAGRLSRKLSDGMVVGQIAVACVMLVGAGLLLRSFQNVLAVDPGFSAGQVVQGRIDFMSTYLFYPGRSDAAVLKRRIYDSMREIPGVESVSFSMFPLFAQDDRKLGQSFRIRGRPLDPSQVRTGHFVSPEFFDTMGIPIIDGRDFDASDDDTSVIVDELFARRYFGDRSAVGAEIWWDTTTPPGPGQPWQRIVGVVPRANLLGLEERDGVPLDFKCNPVDEGSWEYTILLRTTRPAEGVVRDMRARLWEIDPRVPLSYAGAVDASMNEAMLNRRGVTQLLLAFSGLALLLACIGLYAVLGQDVQQRHREIGIRSALGAPPGRLLGMVLRQGLSKAGVGLATGLLGSLFLSRFLESFLFDVASVDPLTYSVILSSMLLVVLAASLIPAGRAAGIDPVEAIRRE